MGSTRYVILGKSYFLSRPQVPYLQNEVLLLPTLMSLFCGYLVCMVMSDRGFHSLKYHLLNGLEESGLLLPHFSAADGEIGGFECVSR